MSSGKILDWHARDSAQVNEKAKLLLLLQKLCAEVKPPLHTFGRPPVPLPDMLFAMVLKVYGKFPGRGCKYDLNIAKEQGLISRVPRPKSIFNYFGKKTVTPYLRELIILSSLPLADVETVFAVDSSGFATSCFARWIDRRYGKASVGDKRIWLKVHLMCGVLTNIVTAVEVSSANAGDSPFFKRLVEVTAKYFLIKEVLADKAYSSLENLLLVRKLKAMPYIPYRVNAKPVHKTRDPLWTRLYHFYTLNEEWFKEHYHKRSNVETTFSMIKRKFGGHLLSRTRTAQVNELLCKIICHNLCVNVQCMYALGIDPDFRMQERLSELS